MLEKIGNKGLYEIYEGLVEGQKVRLSYLDLDSDKVVEFYFMDKGKNSEPYLRFANGELNIGCPDSDFANWRPEFIDRQLAISLVSAIETLPLYIRETIYKGDDKRLIRTISGDNQEGLAGKLL
jgi:hypothetical protein